MSSAPLIANAGEAASSLMQQSSWLRFKEGFIRLLLFSCAMVSVITTVCIILVLVNNALFVMIGDHQAFFQQVSIGRFLTDVEWSPQSLSPKFGVFPLLCGTLLVTLIAGLTGLPLGLLAAVYLSEYASTRTRNIIKPALEILAGIPTVVYGYFALTFVTPYLIKPIFSGGMGLKVDTFNALSAGLIVGVMIIPMVASLSEDALRAVPKSLREAGYALGSTKFDISTRIVLPAAFSGIVASFLLAIARAIGETMIVAMAGGNLPNVTANPLNQIQTMTAFIVNVGFGDTAVGNIEYQSLYAVAFSLFCITLLMNVISQFIMHRYREVYQ